MKKRKMELPAIIGGSSLLVIFAVLCLTVFMLLALSTVQAQDRLAGKSAASAAGYYEADSQAELILSSLRRGEVPEGVSSQGDVYLYSCRISDTQMLTVKVRVQGTEYSVLRWQAQSIADWEADTSMQVWDGE